MTEIKQRRLGASFITAGAIMVTTGAAESQVEKLLTARLPQYWASILVMLGIFCIASGIVIWLTASMSIPHPFDDDFECYKAKRRELPAIHRLAREFLGDEVSPIEVMQRWHGKNSSVFHLIVTLKRTSFESKKRMVGYCCMLPLTEIGVNKITAGEITGRDISIEYIASSRKECAAVYIGGIAAKGSKARAVLLAILRKEFASANRKWSGIFYARPITRDGLRIAKKNGFVAIDPANHGKIGAIYKLEL